MIYSNYSNGDKFKTNLFISLIFIFRPKLSNLYSLALAIAIAMHNIPEGISISVPIYYATNSKIKAISYTALSGLSELFGAIITYLFLKPFINDIVMGLLFSIIAGIMMHISLYELLPTSLKLNNKKITIFSFIFGILFMTINHLIFN